MPYEEDSLYVNTTHHRFEMKVDNYTAFINYKQGGKNVYLIHTEVPSAIEGRGVASALVEKTLQYTEQQNLQVVPLCHFVQAYLEKHPRWKKLVKGEE